MHWIRRAHLYLGLLLFPWAILYGVTGFLFNHPAVVSDQRMRFFTADDLRETPLAALPSAEELADEVVQKLNELQNPAIPYRTVGNSRFTENQFAFAVVESENRTTRILFDLTNMSGTVREDPIQPKPANREPAPFAVTPEPASTAAAAADQSGQPQATGVLLERSIQSQIEASIPSILNRTGFPPGSARVTSIPALQFEMIVDGTPWLVSYQPMTGAVSGMLLSDHRQPELSLRQFLLRLHVTHGYPFRVNTRWLWAIVVDLMAFTMCFWGLSGLAMWWQIKRTRRIGQVIVGLSLTAALILTFSMYP